MPWRSGVCLGGGRCTGAANEGRVKVMIWALVELGAVELRRPETPMRGGPQAERQVMRSWALIIRWKKSLATDPRQQQDWILKCLQGERAHPLATCGEATLCCSPPAMLETPSSHLMSPEVTSHAITCPSAPAESSSLLSWRRRRHRSPPCVCPPSGRGTMGPLPCAGTVRTHALFFHTAMPPSGMPCVVGVWHRV
jgi:hypothetical protein